MAVGEGTNMSGHHGDPGPSCAKTACPAPIRPMTGTRAGGSKTTGVDRGHRSWHNDPNRSSDRNARTALHGSAGPEYVGPAAPEGLDIRQSQCARPMTISSIGDNDPCPCGSGKTYRQCCHNRPSDADPDSNAKRATEMVRKALEGREFGSLEELQAFVTDHVRRQNEHPLDEFHGLSPEQMRSILYRPFASPEVAIIAEAPEDGATAPISRLFGLLAKAIGDQGLKPTATGNLPRAMCREVARSYWDEKTYQDRTRFGAINSEPDFFELHVARLTAGLAGLIRKYRGRFLLTRDARRMLGDNGLAAIYPRLFRTYVERCNWGYWDHYPDLPFIQHAFLFTLYLLARYGTVWRPHRFYEDAFLTAFPMLVSEVPPNDIIAPEQTLRSCYTWRALVHFAGFLGLAVVEPISDKLLCHDYRVKALPLLPKIVHFPMLT